MFPLLPQTDIILREPAQTGQKGESILRPIKTLVDFRNLRSTSTLPSAFLDFLVQEFLDAARETIFPNEVPAEEFILDSFGLRRILQVQTYEAIVQRVNVRFHCQAWM